MCLTAHIQILGSSSKVSYILLGVFLNIMIYAITMADDFLLYAQINDEGIVFSRSTNTSSLEIIFESLNHTLLDGEGYSEHFRIAFIDPKKDILQRYIDFDFTISREDREIFRLSNMSGQPYFPIHSSRGWEIVPVVLDDSARSGEYIFKIIIQGILFHPIAHEESEFRILY